jgi:hypothetical protein
MLLGLALAVGLPPAGRAAQEQQPQFGIKVWTATPEQVEQRLERKAAEIAAEPSVEGLPKRLSHYLRTRMAGWSVVEGTEADAAVQRYASGELGQPSSFVCFGDFNGDGRQDAAAMLRERASGKLRLTAFHQIKVNSNPGNIVSWSYHPYTVTEMGPTAPGGWSDYTIVDCQEPGRFQAPEGGITLVLENHSISFGFSLYFFDGAYQSLVIAD